MTTSNGAFNGLLTRLRTDTRGNTLAIVAATMIPLAGLLGGGIDISRIYLTKTRLQQACDAGALTGRKAMGGGSWTTARGGTRDQAYRMFDANFESGAYGSNSLSREYTESGGKVTGTVSAVLPMTMMRIFAQPAQTIQVVCDAEMRIPNTDVMFVLDVTGSMASTNRGDSQPKIDGLKKAVKCFYEALAKIDTSADCGSTPAGSNNPNVQLRFGFVPYSSNVNVGKLLPNDYIANNWKYQSREWKRVEDGTFTDKTSEGTWKFLSGSKTSSSGFCWGSNPTQSTTSSTTTSTAPDGTKTVTTTYTRTTNGKSCTGLFSYDTFTNYVETKTDVKTSTPNYTAYWEYKQRTLNVSGLKAGGSSWNASVSLPIGRDGADTTVAWNGCIEERQTYRNTDGDPTDDFAPIPSDAKDLDIDTPPDPADPTTQWGPSLPDAVWGRYDGGGNTRDVVKTSSNLSHNYGYACPAEARKLKSYATASPFETYVNSLSPTGNTYHDIGLLWGARFMSPTGIFSSENGFTPQGGTIERHMVFMTDGDTVTSNTDYTAYGVAWWDRRQTRDDIAPGSSILTSEVDTRFLTICNEVKKRNITLWVVSFGTGVTGDTANRLKACSSDPDKNFFQANDTATLIANFRAIADNIAQLRLTK